MRLLAPAKLNLSLRVGRPRADGFHPLRTWMVSIALFDTIDIEKTRSPRLVLFSDHPAAPADSANLVVRAAAALQAEAEFAGHGRRWGMTAHLSKVIPVGAGLGGGSSDAARTLLGLNRLWDLHWPCDRLAGVAASVGSDVPFFLSLPSAWCEGRGERVRAVRAPRPRWALVMLPDFGVSTALAYRRFDERGDGTDLDALNEDPTRWMTFDAANLMAALVNDLEAAAFDIRPELAALRLECERLLGRPVRMSGSGSSLFTLFDEQSEARTAGRRLDGVVRWLAAELAPQIEDDLRPLHVLGLADGKNAKADNVGPAR